MSNSVILVIMGLLIFASGIVIWRGRTEVLLQNSKASRPEEFTTRIGAVLMAYGLFTSGLGLITAQIGRRVISLSSWGFLLYSPCSGSLYTKIRTADGM